MPFPKPGFLNDFWSYNTTNNTWTLIGGSNQYDNAGVYDVQGTPSTANYPSGRYGYASSFDETAREWWLFGGGNINGTLNDLLRYRLNDSTWTWMSGSTSPAQTGSYGTMGVPGSSNVPQSRFYGVSWVNACRKEVWVFGGWSTSNGSCDQLSIGLHRLSWQTAKIKMLITPPLFLQVS